MFSLRDRKAFVAGIADRDTAERAGARAFRRSGMAAAFAPIHQIASVGNVGAVVVFPVSIDLRNHTGGVRDIDGFSIIA